MPISGKYTRSIGRYETSNCSLMPFQRDAVRNPKAAGRSCLHHHEKLDGSGYPDGLKDGQVGAAARIVAICDVFDALTSVRPYKKGFTPKDAAEVMGTWNGHFDRALLKQFFDCMGLQWPSGSAETLQITDEMVGIAQADLKNF